MAIIAASEQKNYPSIPAMTQGDLCQYKHGELWLDAIVLGKVMGLLIIGVDTSHPEVSETFQDYQGTRLQVVTLPANDARIRAGKTEA
ncbi:MAG: hypothetical protein ACFB0G_11225 [Leptolyngbyaceae cyanobacterium]